MADQFTAFQSQFALYPEFTHASINITNLVASKSKALVIFNKEAVSHLRENPVGWSEKHTSGVMVNSLAARADPQQLVLGWEASYRAGSSARLLEQEIAILKARGEALMPALDAAVADYQVTQLANTFRASVALGGSVAQVFAGVGTFLTVGQGALTLRAAIRAAIASLAELAAAVGPGLLVGVSALVYSPKLGNGELPERYAVSTPLDDLSPPADVDLHAVAAANGTVDLPFRLSSRAADDGQSEIIVIATDGVSVPRGVRVVAARSEAFFNRYHKAETHDSPSRTLIWTPIVDNGRDDTLAPNFPTRPPSYEGATVTPVEGRLDVYPEMGDAGFDDYIFVFPVESALPPIYLAFKSPRDMPGTVSGAGQPAAERWLDAATGIGAAIPSQIADQLIGREFSSFGAFRKAFWKAVGADSVLLGQFTAVDAQSLRRGAAPSAPRPERQGKRDKFEIHHVIPIMKGGSVYDVGNLRILTPKRHVEIHSVKE